MVAAIARRHFRADDRALRPPRGTWMAEFIIRPHGRLHDWIADEQGYFRFETVGASGYEAAVIT